MKTKTKPHKLDVGPIVDRLWFHAPTYADVEALAGVTDRDAFWKGKTEDEARAALREMIRARVASGELTG
jgi:hypothetical protein